MSVLKELNLVLKADIRDIQSKMRAATRTIQEQGKAMSEAANKMSLAISLPLAGIGATALKFSGEMESMRMAMRTTFQDAGRSIAEADKELEALRKSAMAPGLDYPQAVKASIRLQNVGLSAENARKTIEQLANAISMSGGTADDLDGVTVQMAQMISKGKVLASDLRIIQERMPKITSLMQEAFGVKTADQLQELGVTGEEFVTKITAKMQELPRVSGGIANSFVNASSAIKQSLASIGDNIAKTFNVQKLAEDFSNWVNGLADSFNGLTDNTKETILVSVALAVALGPVLKIVGGMITTFGTLKNVVKNLSDGMALYGKAMAAMNAMNVEGQLAVTGLTARLNAFKAAWKALDIATKTTIIGALVTVVLAAAVAFSHWTGTMSNHHKIQQQAIEVQREAEKSILAERMEAEAMIKVIRSETSTREEKAKALQRLNELGGEYFKGLSIEKSSVTELNAAYEKYIANLLATANAKAAQQKINDLAAERLELETKLDKMAENAKNRGNVLNAVTAQFRASDLMSASQKISEIDAQMKALAEKAYNVNDIVSGPKENSTEVHSTPKSAASGDAAIKRKLLSVPDLLPAPAEFMDSAKQIADALGAGLGKAVPQVKASAEQFKTALTALGEQYDIIDNKSAVLGDSFDPVKEKIDATKQAIVALLDAGVSPMNYQITAMQENIANLEGSLDKHKETWVEFGESISETVQGAITDSLASIGTGIGEMMAGAVSAKGALIMVIMPMLDMLTEVGKLAIKTGIAVLGIKEALQSLNPYVAIAGGIALIALASFAKAKLSASVPKMAEGGIVDKPTYLLAGEAGPEMIIPPKKFPGVAAMMGYVKKAEGGGGHFTGEFTVKGTDLVLVLERAQQQQFRSYGR